MSSRYLDKITDNIDTVFRGDAWHGPSMMEMFNSLPIEKVDLYQNFSKQTIAQHVFHITAFYQFVLEKLRENIHFSLVSEEENWGTSELTSKSNFNTLVESLKEKHLELLRELEKFDDQLLDLAVPGEFYDFYTLLNGLIQHNTYHLGQIWVLWQ